MGHPHDDVNEMYEPAFKTGTSRIEKIRQSIHEDARLIEKKCMEVRNLREGIKKKEDKIEHLENKLLFQSNK